MRTQQVSRTDRIRSTEREFLSPIRGSDSGYEEITPEPIRQAQSSRDPERPVAD